MSNNTASNTFCKSIKKYLLYLWSLSPLLALTDDNNFGTIELDTSNGSNKMGYRFNLISIFAGSVLICIATFKIHNNEKDVSSYTNRKFKICKAIKFKLIQTITLEGCLNKQGQSNHLSLKNKIENYKRHLNTLSVENMQIERNYILYDLGRLNRIIQSSQTKVNFYLVIFSMLITLYFDNYTFFKECFIINISLFYCSFNLILFILQSLKVRSYSVSQLKSIKGSYNNKLYHETLNYYSDSKYNCDKYLLIVSYVRNIEKWMKLNIFVLFIYWLILLTPNYFTK